jgi:hypothetical protein
MAKYTPADTAEWVADNLRKARLVLNVEMLSGQVLRVSRSNYDPFVAGIVSTARVDADLIRPLVQSRLGVEIIANVPKESYWTGGALTLARTNNIAAGAYGDLLRVTNLENVRAFQPTETEFVERGLRQHNRILSFERVHDRLYRISRKGLPDLTVVMLNEYELTADCLRTARDRYGQFSIAVITDPNGSSTSSANQVAQTMDVEILEWRPFFGRLNKK